MGGSVSVVKVPSSDATGSWLGYDHGQLGDCPLGQAYDSSQPMGSHADQACRTLPGECRFGAAGGAGRHDRGVVHTGTGGHCVSLSQKDQASQL